MTVFGPLQACRDRPLPDQAPARAHKTGFRARAIDCANALFNEALEDLRDHGIAGQNHYNAPRNPPYWRHIDGAVPELLARVSVVAKLKRVNARLGEADLELFVFDAWRPKAVQAYFHDVWMPAQLQKRNPALTGDALTGEVERYWSAPSADAGSPAPHATGAAVDLTIRWRGGEALWMGSLFDDVTALAHRDRFEALPDAMAFSDEEARANRRLLHWVMAGEGFAGHPDEWWHFSYGDQLWAALSGAPAALYGLADREFNPPV